MTWAPSCATGLPRTVKQRCGTHADPDTRKLATELSRKWAAAEAPAAAATAAAPPPPPTQRPGSGLAQRPGSVAGSVGTGGARAPTPQAGQLAAMELDEEAQRELEEAEAEARAAAEEAAAYAARAAELEASVAADAPSSAAESIGSFQVGLRGASSCKLHAAWAWEHGGACVCLWRASGCRPAATVQLAEPKFRAATAAAGAYTCWPSHPLCFCRRTSRALRGAGSGTGIKSRRVRLMWGGGPRAGTHGVPKPARAALVACAGGAGAMLLPALHINQPTNLP